MTSTYKQLSFDERIIIQNLLSDPNITLKMIALTLNRSPEAIRYGITHHLRIVVRANIYNKCGRQNQCDRTRLCTHCLQGHCKFCKHDNCNDLCPYFISTPIYKHTSRFPYVCNNCPDTKTCKLPKVFYMADVAQKQRDDNVSSWKEGSKKSEAQMETISNASRMKMFPSTYGKWTRYSASKAMMRNVSFHSCIQDRISSYIIC